MNHNEYFRETGKDALFKTWHASDRYMLIYMHSEGGSIVCSENIYPIQQGVLCLIGAGKYHYTMPDRPERYVRTKLFLAPDRFQQILRIGALEESFGDTSLVYAQLDTNAQNAAIRIFEELETCDARSEGATAILTSAWLRLLVLLTQNAIENTVAVTGFLNHAMDYINRNILTEITMDDICAAAHMSKYYFCRKFKESTGMTVMEYILKTRIVLAKNMLLRETASVTEISERCCFSSISYFCRVFKEDTGCTPTAYRRKSRNKLGSSPDSDPTKIRKSP